MKYLTLDAVEFCRCASWEPTVELVCGDIPFEFTDVIFERQVIVDLESPRPGTDRDSRLSIC